MVAIGNTVAGLHWYGNNEAGVAAIGNTIAGLHGYGDTETGD